MSIQKHSPNTLKNVDTLKVSQTVSAFALGCVAIMFTASATAQENVVTGTVTEEKSAYTYIKSEESLLKDEISLSENSGNVAIISQIGDGNRNIINQNTTIQGSANFASIDQVGNFNEANINQEGSLNIGIIDQDGNRHEANITQTGNNFESEITQTGFDGKVNISQSGSGYRSISIEQQSYSGNAKPVTIDTY
jgi:minor curlin subunit